MAERNPILTIGHSKHTLQRFVALLQRARVTTVADVRSAPVSRFLPHFNKDRLAASLGECGVAYVFLGKDLGGRPERPHLFTGGVADYEKMAQIPSFRSGLERLVAGAKHHRIAAMCAEADPLDCHRCLLVGRALAAESMDVGHILASGEIVGHAEIEGRLLGLAGLADGDLLATPRDERLAQAYRAHAAKAAYTLRKSPVSARAGTARRD